MGPGRSPSAIRHAVGDEFGGHRDQYRRVPFDLSAVLWIVTATDSGAIAEPVRDRLR